MSDLLHEHISNLEKHTKRLKNRTAPTVPIYDLSNNPNSGITFGAGHALKLSPAGTNLNYAQTYLGADYTEIYYSLDYYRAATGGIFILDLVYDPSPPSNPFTTSYFVSQLAVNTIDKYIHEAGAATVIGSDGIVEFGTATRRSWHNLAIHAKHTGFTGGHHFWDFDGKVDGVSWGLGTLSYGFDAGSFGSINTVFINNANGTPSDVYIDNIKIGTTGFGSSNLIDYDFEGSMTVVPPFDLQNAAGLSISAKPI